MAEATIAHLSYAAPYRAAERTLLVMLPGVGCEAEAFAAHGFIASLHARGAAIDVIAARPPLDLYLDGNIDAALHETVIAPALARGYERLWLLGISLGGMGALLYAAAQRVAVDGVVLLAPFLGTPGTIAEIVSAGGIPAWSAPASRATGGERTALLWLQDYIVRSLADPALYLGYARQDRFAPGHRLLAQHLPSERVVAIEGGHDWNSWAMLWGRLLERCPWAAKPGAR